MYNDKLGWLTSWFKLVCVQSVISLPQHKGQWEIRQREEEIAELQKALSDMQVQHEYTHTIDD